MSFVDYMVSRIAVAVIMTATAINAFAQVSSSDVVLESMSGSDATFKTSIVAEKANEEAEGKAVVATISTLINQGVEGVKNGQPMLFEPQNSYEYRLLTTKRYGIMLSGDPIKEKELKFNGAKKITYIITLNLRALKADVEKQDLALNPVWMDKTQVSAKSSLNPVIVVVPETDSEANSFEDMRNLIHEHPVVKTAVNKVTELFSDRGYKTRDFITTLENSKTTDFMTSEAQTDRKAMVVQQLPGDIVVTVDVDIKTSGATNGANLNIKAVEKQTETTLSSESFTSKMYHISDQSIIIDKAVELIGPDFFAKLDKAFDDMVKKGRSVNLEFKIHETVSDWDFDTECPADGSDFKEELDEWLSSKCFQGIYDMSLSTDKLIIATINIPLWDYEKNRSYKILNFTSALKRFLKSKLGEDYKGSVTSLGQKLSIMIE